MNALTQPEMLALSDQSKRAFNEILDRNAKELAEQRSQAAARIRAGMRRLKPSAKGLSAKELLHRVRYGRHGL